VVGQVRDGLAATVASGVQEPAVGGQRALTQGSWPSVVRKYDNGASIRQLAEDTGRSYGFVHRLLAEADVTLRGRGGNTRRKDK
jgi:hypothetical protein